MGNALTKISVISVAKKDEKLKTRPDLDDKAWIVWLTMQPENRGILVAEMYRKMLEWCQKKGVTPTRLRLLKWLDGEREAMPMTYEPAYLPDAQAFERGTPRNLPVLPDCDVCNNERFVSEIIDPNAQFEWQRSGMVPCTACNDMAETSK